MLVVLVNVSVCVGSSAVCVCVGGAGGVCVLAAVGCVCMRACVALEGSRPCHAGARTPTAGSPAPSPERPRGDFPGKVARGTADQEPQLLRTLGFSSTVSTFFSKSFPLPYPEL